MVSTVVGEEALSDSQQVGANHWLHIHWEAVKKAEQRVDLVLFRALKIK